MNKKGPNKSDPPVALDVDLLRRYMMGAANPKFSNKFSELSDAVDLHLEEKQVGKGKIAPEDALFHQLEKFEEALDRAIASGQLELRVVHGFGKGKLKAEIDKLLKKNKHVRSFTNDYHMRYGYGSTLILLK